MKRRKLIKNIDYKINNEKELILMKEITSRYYRMKIKINNEYIFLRYGIEENKEIYFEDESGECTIYFDEILEDFELKNFSENDLINLEIY